MESAGGERCSRLPLYKAVSIVPMKAKDHNIHMTNRDWYLALGRGKNVDVQEACEACEACEMEEVEQGG